MIFELEHTESLISESHKMIQEMIRRYAEERLGWIKTSSENSAHDRLCKALLESEKRQRIGPYAIQTDWVSTHRTLCPPLPSAQPSPNYYRSLLNHFVEEDDQASALYIKDSLTGIYEDSIASNPNYQNLKLKVSNLQSYLRAYKDKSIVQNAISELRSLSKLIAKAEKTSRASKRRYNNTQKNHSSLFSFYSLDVHRALCPLS